MTGWLAAPIGGDAARRAAERELGRPEYHRDDRSLVLRAVDWLFGHLGSAVSGGSPLTGVLLLLALLTVVLLGIAWRAGRLPGWGRARRRGGDADPLRPDSGADHRDLAERYTAAGRWALALREWLREAVGVLEARAVLSPRPGRTGTQIVREAADRLPDAATALTEATETFERVWFGGRDASAADVELGRRAADAVRDARAVDAGPAGGYAVPR